MNKDMHKKLRNKLLAQLPEKSAVVLFAPGELRRNGDVHYPFRQESYFHYFTGFPESDTVAVFLKEGSRFILYSRRHDPLYEIWQGKIIGQQGAMDNYGADAAFPLEEVGQLASQLGDVRHLYGILGENAEDDRRLSALLREIHQRAGRGGADVKGLGDIRALAAEMRLHKEPEEIALLKQATAISARGHAAAMLAAQSATHEYQVQAALEASFMGEGCHWSFPSIVAAGANGCCLHYTSNNAPIKKGEMMLVDGGAELDCYAGDLTRTFPVGGKFSREQQAIYEIVLAAQQEGINNAVMGRRHMDLHAAVTKVLMQGLLDLGVIDKDLDYWLAENRFKQFYPHGTGHWLGLDVHDVGIYTADGASRPYQEHMLITVEPGLYLQRHDTTIAEKWRGLAVRIEDDVLITKNGPEVFDATAAPKAVAEVEKFIADHRK